MKSFKLLLKTKYVLLALLVTAAGCADLSVDNQNSPTTDQVLSSPADIESLVQTGFVSWWQAQSDVYVNGLRVGSDVYSCSWGNFDMRNRGTEPRIPYDNNPTASSDAKNMSETPWYGIYAVLAQANDFLIQLNETDLVIPSNEDGVSDADYTSMVEASAYLLQGLALGDIGLYFDKGFIFDETTPEEELLNLEFSTYQDILAAADAKLAKAAQTASGLSGVTLGDNYISGYNTMDMSTEFVELVNSLRARYMVLGARTPAENSSIDWNTVKSFAQDGLSFDFSPVGDDEFWFSNPLLYNNHDLNFWTRTDQSIISTMDPSQPATFPTDGSDPGQATSDDERLETDWVYNGSIPYPASRGLYFYTHYTYQRYIEHSFFTGAFGPMPHILKAENDLMFAEAVARTNDAANYSAAAQAINNTREGRGGLDPILATDFGTGTALDAIRYEREIELFNSGFMQATGDRRRFGELQTGSLLHYPVPAKELLILQQELYTFGGVNNAGQDGTASKLQNNPFDIPLKSVKEVEIPSEF